MLPRSHPSQETSDIPEDEIGLGEMGIMTITQQGDDLIEIHESTVMEIYAMAAIDARARTRS